MLIEQVATSVSSITDISLAQDSLMPHSDQSTQRNPPRSAHGADDV